MSFNTSQKINMAVIKPLLQERVGAVARQLAPGGKVIDGVYKPKNPTRNDKKPGSFCIWLSGEARGAWVDYATGEKGDVIDLIQYCGRLRDRAAALSWAKDWLGGDAVYLPAPLPSDQATIAKRDKTSSVIDKKNAQAAASWFAAGQPLTGSLGETYLHSRGLYAVDGDWPVALKFFERLKHRQSGTSCPVIMAAMTNAAGNIGAVHRTFLAANGADKASLGKSGRLIWPAFRGCVIRLRSTCKNGLLIITEGLENGLSVMMADPDAAVWAAGSLGNFAALRVPAVPEIIVFADNDWGKEQAERALEAGLANLRAQCPRVLVARSPIGSDANDALRA